MGGDLPPHVSTYLDRHGKRRWRFRRAGKTVPLPAPDDPRFESAYQAALEGRPLRTVQPMPGAALPRSMRAAWNVLRTSDPDWKALAPRTRHVQGLICERFLKSPVVESEPLLVGDAPIDRLARRHVKAILAARSATPHAAKQLLEIIRKLVGVALDEEWIENDPTARITLRPKTKGWKAWPADVRAKFEKHWPLGSAPRTAYALALYFGHRRSDVVAVKWSDVQNVTQRKTGKVLWLPIHPTLRTALEAVERRGDTVLVNAYGHPFTANGLTVRMRDWTALAGIPPGFTMHGLRKTLGKDLAEAGATTRQIMAVLGHDDIKHAELYTAEAEQKRLAKAGMKKLSPRKRRG